MERKHTYLRLRQCALRAEEPMAEAMVQAACVRRDNFKPAPLPAALAARLAG
jgi:acyl-CoA thioesterase FadM